MDTLFINSEKARTPKKNRLTLKLQNKMDLSVRKKSKALANLSIYFSWKNISSALKNNELIVGYEESVDKRTVPIIAGSYSAKSISDYIIGAMKENKDKDSTLR